MADIAINPVVRRVQFTGNTGLGPFAFTFNILQNTDIIVYKNTTLLTLTTDYTVTINANGTGSVTLTGSGSGTALITTDNLTIIGGRELSRTTDFVTAGDLLASSLNEQLDSNVIMSQQLDERFSRTISVSPGDADKTLTLPTVDDRKDKILKFDTEGNVEAAAASTVFANTVVGANFTNNVFTGDGSTVAFTTTVAAGSKNNCQIYIDGVYQEKASFTINATTLTFTEAPPLNASIEVIIGNAIETLDADSGNINYNQGGTGAQTRTVESKLRDTVSVKDFGAVGDGVVDDTAAIQAAIDATVAQGGGTVYFPAGTYKVTSVITTPTSRNDNKDDGSVLRLHGDSGGTWLTRDNIAMPDYDDDIASFKVRHDSAILAIRGGNLTLRDINFEKAAIGIYIGDDPDRTDVDFATMTPLADLAAQSFNHIENIKVHNCGCAVFMESTHGIYYNTFQTWHLKQCNVGIATRNATGAVARVNRNTFINIRANRCPIGFLFEDFNTNALMGVHTEACKIGATNLNAALNNTDALTPTGISFDSLITSNGCGIIMLSEKNEFFGCQSESNIYDLYIHTSGATNNGFHGCFFDDINEKVWNAVQARYYLSRNVTKIQTLYYRTNAASAQEIAQGWTGPASTQVQIDQAKLTNLSVTDNGDADVALTVDRASQGDTIEVKEDGTKRGVIGVKGDEFYFSASAGAGLRAGASSVVPTDDDGDKADNAVSLGLGAYRYSVVYAATGTINTSDQNEKQQIADLSASELAVATAIKGLIKKFKFNDAVTAKGDNARIHVGVIAQDVEAAFTAQGLDASDYGIFCEDTWTDEDGNQQTRKGVRYEELLAFVIAAL